MKIGVDVDDVLANFVGRHAEIARGLFGKPAVGVLPVDWDMSNYGLTDKQHSQVWDEIKRTRNFWLTLGTKPGVSLLPTLNLDHDLYFITARVPTAGLGVEAQTALWLEENFSGVFRPVVIAAVDKGLLVKSLKLDAFIDDRLKNCNEVKAACPDCQVYLKQASHNERESNVPFPRAASFDDFAREFLKFPQPIGGALCQATL